MNRAGRIWERTPRERSQTVRRVCEALRGEYGTPRHGNPDDPLDDLVYLVVSARTSVERTEAAYWNLKRAFPDWSDLVEAPRDQVVEVLAPAGLSERKASWIRTSLARLRGLGGDNPSLWLRSLPQDEQYEHLVGLPGVSDKVARCVMSYALGREVLAVDVHVHRVSLRLGWTAETRPEVARVELEELIAPQWRLTYHACCVAHGRERCRSRNPLCETCPVQKHCDYYTRVRLATSSGTA